MKSNRSAFTSSVYVYVDGFRGLFVVWFLVLAATAAAGPKPPLHRAPVLSHARFRNSLREFLVIMTCLPSSIGSFCLTEDKSEIANPSST
jgi:hypothetical protein